MLSFLHLSTTTKNDANSDLINACFFLLSCKKVTEKFVTEEVNSTGVILGTLELKESYGGMSAYTVFPPGNDNLLTFDNTTYKMIASGQAWHQGTYSPAIDSVTNVNTCALEPPPSDTPNRLIFDNDLFHRRGFVVTGNTLTITSGCNPADGGVTKSRRMETAQVQ